ncbi:flagellar export chaperone FliS [Cohnella sp.]|uniref:flagellar export chaperone FliS n=1 Tax=Cohnella sp. TaxID=1883426 RepID=UPI0035699A22
MNAQSRMGYQAYQKNKYETASPHKLILMLYDAGLTNIGRARQALAAKNMAEANRFMKKTQEIVFELLSCLNEEQGESIAKNMKEIYLYLIRLLTEANVRKNAELLNEPEGILKQFRDTWEQIGKEVGNGG